MDFNETAVFVKVVQVGSFSAAARLLHLPTSTVSTRVARLEKRLGVTLLHRTTRRLNLTEAGNVFYQHAATGLVHMLEAEASVTASLTVPKGHLRVTAPADFGDAIFTDLITQMRRAYPEIDIELILTDRPVDMVADEIDVAIRAGELKDTTSLVAKRVGIACWAVFASPNYLRIAPPLTKPQNLRKHNCLQFTPLGKNQWELANTKDSITVPMDGRIIVNDIGYRIDDNCWRRCRLTANLCLP
ncbi:MAG: LysR family transcriptional regulator [Gallionella sp.]